MKDTPLPRRRRLEQLFQDLEDGTISFADHTELMGLLRKDASLRVTYLKHTAVSTGLHELAESWGADHKPSGLEASEVSERRILKRSFLAAAAILILLVAIAGFTVIREQLRPSIAISEGVSTSWRYATGGLGDDGEFLPGTQFVVESGTLEITNRNQSRMVLEAPATLEIYSPVKAILREGKAWFDVVPKDKGFTVGTDRIRVVDLGTRFGLISSPGSDLVQVDSGLVRIESRHASVPSIELTGGEATRTNVVGRCSAVPYDRERFLTSPLAEMIGIHWSFDEDRDGSFPATAVGVDPVPMRLKSFGSGSPTRRVVAGRFGAGLDLTAVDTFAESEFRGILGSGPRTVAFWVRATPIKRRYRGPGNSYTPAVLAWGDPEGIGSIWSIRAHTASGVVGTQWDPSGSQGWIISGKHGKYDILDDQWHHLVSVYSGADNEAGQPEVRHYIDGQHVPVRTTSLGHPIETLDGMPLRLAYDIDNREGPSNSPFLIDELWILRGALDDDAVRLLHAENRLPEAP